MVVPVAGNAAAASLLWSYWRSRVRQWERDRAATQAFSRQLIASQENERKRIAAELHDSLGQRLVVIKNLALFFLRSQEGTAISNGRLRLIEEISEEAALAADESREISYNLRPFQLDRLGLSKAIEGIIRTASDASAICFSSELDNIDDVFPEALRINFYRIVQESSNNIIKHSNATEASINIKRTVGGVTLTIRDNGAGFTPANLRSEANHKLGRDGFGLTGMTERASLLGGDLTVHTVPGRGTIVSVQFHCVRTQMADDIRILLADDHPVVRKGLQMALAEDPGLEVVAEAADGEAALTLIQQLLPQIAVLDIDMPKLDGFGVAREIAARQLPVATIFLTMHTGEDPFRAAMDLGAKGYILKDSAMLEIVAGVRAVAPVSPI